MNWTILIIVAIVVLLLNIPFGYWRENVRKFSAQWFLAIHLPVPAIIALRFASHIGFAWYTYVFLVSSFFIGQKAGSIIYKKLSKAGNDLSSCLVMDLFRRTSPQAS